MNSDLFVGCVMQSTSSSFPVCACVCNDRHGVNFVKGPQLVEKPQRWGFCCLPVVFAGVLFTWGIIATVTKS